MTWQEYYNKFYDWAESTQISRISSITDFSGASSLEVVELALYLGDEAASTRLVKKALHNGVRFTADDVLELIDWMSPKFQSELVRHACTPYTDEQLDILTFTLSEEDVRTLMRSGISASAKSNHIASAAHHAPIKSPSSKARQSNFAEASTQELHQVSVWQIIKPFLCIIFFPIAILLLMVSALVKDKSKSSSRSHYGYRYGRWYYGRGHTRGCQETGKKCK